MYSIQSRLSRSQKSLKALTFNQELKQEVLSDMIFKALDFVNKTFHLSLDNSDYFGKNSSQYDFAIESMISRNFCTTCMVRGKILEFHTVYGTYLATSLANFCNLTSIDHFRDVLMRAAFITTLEK